MSRINWKKFCIFEASRKPSYKFFLVLPDSQHFWILQVAEVTFVNKK